MLQKIKSFVSSRKKNQTNNHVKSMKTSSSHNAHFILYIKAVTDF